MTGEQRDLLNVVADDALTSIFIHRPTMEITEFWYVIVMGSVLVGHPSATGRDTALYIAEANRKTVVAGHTHYRSQQWSRDDSLLAIEAGMCADPKKLSYVSQRLPARTRGVQRQGAAIIYRGTDGKVRPYLLTPHDDFQAMRRLYAA